MVIQDSVRGRQVPLHFLTSHGNRIFQHRSASSRVSPPFCQTTPCEPGEGPRLQAQVNRAPPLGQVSRTAQLGRRLLFTWTGERGTPLARYQLRPGKPAPDRPQVRSFSSLTYPKVKLFKNENVGGLLIYVFRVDAEES